MQRRIWKARLMPGMLNEYVRRHNEIWPEMVQALRACGIHNYTIWNHGEELIGYYECPDLEMADQYKVRSDVMRKWSVSMAGIMEMITDSESGLPLQYTQVFELD